MPAIKKRAALGALTKVRLAEIASAFGLDVASDKRKSDFIESLASSRKASLERVLNTLTQKELISICCVNQLDESGTGEDLVNRLLGRACQSLVEREDVLPPLAELAARHPGVTPEVAAVYTASAAVCFSRHHSSPIEIKLERPDAIVVRRSVSWREPDARTESAYANRDDATRDAAYGISIAVVEAEFELFAVSRAETQTGADYYVNSRLKALEGVLDLEGAYRLEVSGTDDGDEGVVRRRLRQKVKQLRDGDSDLPGIAAVVGFRICRVGLEWMVDE